MGEPWCFYNTKICSLLNFNQTNIGFTQDNIDTFTSYFMNNIDISNSGMTIASPDKITPAGSYVFHWERDSAITMNTLILISNELSD